MPPVLCVKWTRMVSAFSTNERSQNATVTVEVNLDGLGLFNQRAILECNGHGWSELGRSRPFRPMSDLRMQECNGHGWSELGRSRSFRPTSDLRMQECNGHGWSELGRSRSFQPTSDLRMQECNGHGWSELDGLSFFDQRAILIQECNGHRWSEFGRSRPLNQRAILECNGHGPPVSCVKVAPRNRTQLAKHTWVCLGSQSNEIGRGDSNSYGLLQRYHA
jgi:hypothetical protein